MKTLVVSTIWTSLLHATSCDKWFVLSTAWHTDKTISDQDRLRLLALEDDMKTEVSSNWVRSSAEINAISRIFTHFSLQPQDTMHLLVWSDTLQSTIITKVLTEYLMGVWVWWVFAHHESWLNGVNVQWFNHAVKWLVRKLMWQNGILTEYQNSWVSIISNTTGWFKPMASVIEWLSPLFAKHVVSIFQWSDELYIRRPISLDTGFVDRFFAECLLLAQDEPIHRKFISKDFPENLLEEIDDENVTFSDIALALFLRHKWEFRGINNLNLPFLKLESSFLTDINNLNNVQLERLLEVLGKVSLLLIQSNWDISPLKADWWIQYSEYFSQWVGHFRWNLWMRIVTKKDNIDWWIKLLYFWTHDYTEWKAKNLK